jgi:hypothetical protein
MMYRDDVKKQEPVKSTQSNQRLAFYAVVSAMGIILGCTGPEDYEPSASNATNASATSTSATNTSAGGTGSGDADGGDPCPCGEGACMWPEVDNGASIPVCGHGDVSAFEGTIDGKAFKESYTASYTSVVPWKDPPELSLQFDSKFPVSFGALHLQWAKPTVWGKFMSVTGGTLKLPTEDFRRAVMPGSQVRLKCQEGLWQYILIVEGGQLNACSGS